MTGGTILNVLENDVQVSYEQSTTMIQAGSVVGKLIILMNSNTIVLVISHTNA